MSHKTVPQTAEDRTEIALPTVGGDFLPAQLWNPASWLQIEYQQVEIRMTEGRTEIRGQRTSLRDGVISEERFSATGPDQLFQQASEQMLRQTEAMLQMMMAPWLSLFSPAFLPNRRRDD